MIICREHKWHKFAIFVKCDACTLTSFVDGSDGQTDRLIAHEWIHENGWRTMQHRGKWIQLCPKCKDHYYEIKRNQFFDSTMR